jgi:hypothetical protein
MKSIHIVSEDRVGLVADIAYLMDQARIGIEGLCIEVRDGKAYIKLDVSDPICASEILSSNNFKVVDEEEMEIRPRGLVRELVVEARKPGGDRI